MDNTLLLIILFGGVLVITYQTLNRKPRPTHSGGIRTIPRDPPAPQYMKAQVIARAHGRCEGCGHHFKGTLDVHHIKPRSVGGRNTLNNLIALCPNCHRIAHSKR